MTPATEPAPAADAERFTPTVAVLVIHGMGQQIPFETLDSVAQGLTRAAEPEYQTAVKVERADLGARRVGRVDMTFTNARETTKVHLYEAYWAPLTEGQIGLGGVMTFLWRAGINGTWNHVTKFTRRIFGSPQSYEPPVRTLIFTLIALAVVGSLVVMNGAIAAVAAATALYGPRAGWLTPALYDDFTAVFTWVLAAASAFAGALWLNRARRGGTGARAAGILAVALFAVLLVVLVAAGLALPLLALYHARTRGAVALVPGASSSTGPLVATVLVAAVLGLLLLYVVVVIVVRTLREWVNKGRGMGLFSPFVTAGFVGFVAFIALELVFFAGRMGGGQGGFGQPAILWALLVAISAYVRQLLVEYPGDVAIYVQPQALDRYSETRGKIRSSVGSLAAAIYDSGAKGPGVRYDGIVIAGHSLGSVVAYDILNQLVADDAALAPANRDVVGRTRMLLTFGSPLDKTTFFFTKQKKSHSGSVWAELGTAFQPLIDDPATRAFRWINIHSRWDVVSGSLDYFDTIREQELPDDQKAPGTVRNHLDSEATTFLAAHIEYWLGTTIYAAMLSGIDGKPFPRS
ncbi:MAG: hypothetical protein FJ027_06260 [Candidatus Rokubacteria bacterium]|nr:hypothetical protein [Candidatus Rokubacteria bacterium]